MVETQHLKMYNITFLLKTFKNREDDDVDSTTKG